MYLREVKVKNGMVRGLPAADPRITVFKGIPFAAPPVGDLRWKAPQPAKDWEGVFEAYRFGPIAMQDVPGKNPDNLYSKEWHVDSDIAMSEDCLHLNVWTPAKTGDEKLPVMVWIYGGGLRSGYPSEMEFDGERIARRGVILVSVNYRLNAFGFLAHPDLTAEDPKFPTNFGHLDQRAGIQWVKDNIAAFGGDPENITIFGQSAGGGSTFVQITSPLNKGLFQKAICHSSGGLIAPSVNSLSLREAEEFGKNFLADCGVSTIEEARKLDAEFIESKAIPYIFGTVIGDGLVPEKPSYTVMKNNRNNVAVMTGYTRDEANLRASGETMADLEAFAAAAFQDRAGEYLDIVKKFGGSVENMMEKGRYNRFEIGALLWADVNNELGASDMYLYCFDQEMPGDESGNFHSSELWFVFESLAKCWRPFKGKDYDLARKACNYWTNFAKTGNPNGVDNDGTPMPEWKPLAPGYVHPLIISDDIHMDETPRSEVNSFVMDYYRKRLEAGEEIVHGPMFRTPSKFLK